MIHLPKNDITRANIIKGKLYRTKKSWSRKIDCDYVYEFFRLLGLGLKFNFKKTMLSTIFYNIIKLSFQQTSQKKLIGSKN